MLRPKLLLKLFTPINNFSALIEPPSIKTPTKKQKNEPIEPHDDNLSCISHRFQRTSVGDTCTNKITVPTIDILYSEQAKVVRARVCDRPEKRRHQDREATADGHCCTFWFVCVCVTDVILHVHNTKTCKFSTKLFSFTNDCYDVSRHVFLIQNVCRRSIAMKKNMHIKRWIASTISLYADWH